MAIQATALAFIAVQPIERFILQRHRFVKLVFHFIVSAIIALRGFVMLRVAIVEKRLNAVIDFAEVAVILAELCGVAVYAHEFILVGDVAIVQLVGVVGFSKDI